MNLARPKCRKGGTRRKWGAFRALFASDRALFPAARLGRTDFKYIVEGKPRLGSFAAVRDHERDLLLLKDPEKGTCLFERIGIDVQDPIAIGNHQNLRAAPRVGSGKERSDEMRDAKYVGDLSQFLMGTLGSPDHETSDAAGGGRR